MFRVLVSNGLEELDGTFDDNFPIGFEVQDGVSGKGATRPSITSVGLRVIDTENSSLDATAGMVDEVSSADFE